MDFKELIITLIMIRGITSLSTDCYKMAGCQNQKTKVDFRENEKFTDVNEERGSCAICTCIKNKQYVASCMEPSVVSRQQPILKSAIFRSIFRQNNAKTSPSYGKDKEIELTEAEAVAVQCEYESTPKYDKETQSIQYRFINYYFVTWESTCCRKSKTYGNVHAYCKVIFNNKCKPKAVLRDRQKLRCPMPMRKYLRG